MAELKTKKTGQTISSFINSIPDLDKRNDCKTILKMMKKTTKENPKMWGPSIVGFGDVHYKYESGREGDWFVMGLSPRKQNLTMYFCYGVQKAKSLSKLGKFKTGTGCLYVKSLKDVNEKILQDVIDECYAVSKKITK
jgi:hypothetical protein